MREAEKREFAEKEKFEELLRKAENTFGKQSVTASTDADGNRVITIVSGRKKVTRKEHTFKESMLRNGDWVIRLTKENFSPGHLFKSKWLF